MTGKVWGWKMSRLSANTYVGPGYYPPSMLSSSFQCLLIISLSICMQVCIRSQLGSSSLVEFRHATRVRQENVQIVSTHTRAPLHLGLHQMTTELHYSEQFISKGDARRLNNLLVHLMIAIRIEALRYVIRFCPGSEFRLLSLLMNRLAIQREINFIA